MVSMIGAAGVLRWSGKQVTWGVVGVVLGGDFWGSDWMMVVFGSVRT